MATMYDSTRPWLIPNSAQYIAIYYNGAYAADRAKVQAQYPRARIFTIDVLGTAAAQCGIADVETGDMTPADVPGWVDERLAAGPNFLARLYSNLSTWPAVKAEVAKLSAAARQHVVYFVANPTGAPHIVPGSDGTQYEWGSEWDASEIDERFITLDGS